jgi:hypothetical protein
MSLDNHIHAVDIFLAVLTQETRLLKSGIEPDLDGILETLWLFLLLLF